MSSALRQPNFAVLLGLAWLLVALQLLLFYWTGTAERLLDTDDAMRLVQVRAFLAGQGWFDLTETRVAVPGGYESHWSRLIDAGLAGLFLLFNLFADGPLAERLMRTVWPMLWLVPAMVGVAAIAWRIAGREAALAVLALVVMGLPALQEFKPGSIDHHNVQITLSVLIVAATVWSDRLRWTAWAAGALTGLALAIGLEGLPYLVLCGAAFAVRYVVDRNGADALGAYGMSLAVATLAAFVVSVGPDHWGRSLCDAIAINLAAPVVIGGLLLAAAARVVAGKAIVVRCLVIGAIGGVVLTWFVAIEPRCVAGPFAMVDPVVRSIWLEQVYEMQPITAFGRMMPVKTAAILAFPMAALLSALLLAADAALRRDCGFLVASAVLAVSFVTMVAAIKANPYPMWLGMPLAATAALRLPALFNLGTFRARLLAILMLTPTVLSAGAIGVAEAAFARPAAEDQTGLHNACFKTESYSPLARLPAGIVAANVDFGPFVLALTSHSVLAAPYHRLSVGILAAQRVFAAPPEEAQRLLARMHATYVVTCGSHAPVGLSQARLDASLWGRLHAGAVPDWLEPMPQVQGAFTAYRMKGLQGPL